MTNVSSCTGPDLSTATLGERIKRFARGNGRGYFARVFVCVCVCVCVYERERERGGGEE